MAVLISYFNKCKRIIGGITLILVTCNVFPQYGTKANFKNIDFELVNDKIIITYDLVSAKSSEYFDIKVAIYNTDGHQIDAKTFEGQFTNVRKGKKKKIIWYIQEDFVNFEDNIYVELTAIHKNYDPIIRISRIEALAKSTLWPGWGSAQLTLKKSHYIKGVLGYSFLGAAITYNAFSHQEPDFYTTLSYVSLGFAGLIWTWDYGKVLGTPNISKKIQLDVDMGYNHEKIVPMLSFKVNL